MVQSHRMQMPSEKLIVLIIVGIFALISLKSSTVLDGTVTGEDAIAISRNAKLVMQGLSSAAYPRATCGGAVYYNSSYVEWAKQFSQKIGEIYKDVPEGHSVWEVTWTFQHQNDCGGYGAIIVIDAETGIIVREDLGVGLA